MKQIFDLDKGITQAISHFSRYDDAGRRVSEDGRFIYSGICQITAEDKIRQFYSNTIRFLWIAAISLFAITNAALWIEMYSQ